MKRHPGLSNSKVSGEGWNSWVISNPICLPWAEHEQTGLPFQHHERFYYRSKHQQLTRSRYKNFLSLLKFTVGVSFPNFLKKTMGVLLTDILRVCLTSLELTNCTLPSS